MSSYETLVPLGAVSACRLTGPCCLFGSGMHSCMQTQSIPGSLDSAETSPCERRSNIHWLATLSLVCRSANAWPLRTSPPDGGRGKGSVGFSHAQIGISRGPCRFGIARTFSITVWFCICDAVIVWSRTWDVFMLWCRK
jgi:hypothetical protein